jgi:hypothetical protein
MTPSIANFYILDQFPATIYDTFMTVFDDRRPQGKDRPE